MSCPCRLVLTNEALYLQPVPLNNIGTCCSLLFTAACDRAPLVPQVNPFRKFASGPSPTVCADVGYSAKLVRAIAAAPRWHPPRSRPRSVGLEVTLSDGNGVFLAFETQSERDATYSQLQELIAFHADKAEKQESGIVRQNSSGKDVSASSDGNCVGCSLFTFAVSLCLYCCRCSGERELAVTETPSHDAPVARTRHFKLRVFDVFELRR